MTSLFFPDFLITPLHVFSPFEYVSVAELHAVEKMHRYDTIRALLSEETRVDQKLVQLGRAVFG